MSDGNNVRLVADIVEQNGLTIRQNNLLCKHLIPLGSLVEIVTKKEAGDYKENYHSGLRLFVVTHERDCDGSPLYGLSYRLDVAERLETIKKELLSETDDSSIAILTMAKLSYEGAILHGFCDGSLKVIEAPMPEEFFYKGK